jgi:hypothetical protein
MVPDLNGFFVCAGPLRQVGCIAKERYLGSLSEEDYEFSAMSCDWMWMETLDLDTDISV